MRMRRARAEAARWVERYGAREPDFVGAYFCGSTVAMSDGDLLPRTSDVDVIVVVARDTPPPKLGKLVYNEVLLDVAYVVWDQLFSAKAVLTSYQLANSFSTDTIIADPTGNLRRLYDLVAPRFPKRPWARRRCDDAQRRIEHGLREIDPAAPFPEQLTSWLFATGVTAQALLVASLRNPTVRRRYVAANEVLDEYGFPEVHRELLELLGCVHLVRRRVEHHLRALAETFDATVDAARSRFTFSTDISALARPLAIDGSQELIEDGYHREAMFWIIGTFARCHTILAADAPRSLRRELTPPFDALLADIGVSSPDDIARRAEDTLRFLPRLSRLCTKITSSSAAD